MITNFLIRSSIRDIWLIDARRRMAEDSRGVPGSKQAFFTGDPDLGTAKTRNPRPGRELRAVIYRNYE